MNVARNESDLRNVRHGRSAPQGLDAGRNGIAAKSGTSSPTLPLVDKDVIRDFISIVRAAQDVVAAWRIGNVHQDHWVGNLSKAFTDVPDERRAAFHAALDLESEL